MIVMNVLNVELQNGDNMTLKNLREILLNRYGNECVDVDVKMVVDGKEYDIEVVEQFSGISDVELKGKE